jgi:hypothetical protein
MKQFCLATLIAAFSFLPIASDADQSNSDPKWGDAVGGFQMSVSLDSGNALLHCHVRNAEKQMNSYNDFEMGYCENITLEIKTGSGWAPIDGSIFPPIANIRRGAVPTDSKVRNVLPGAIITETWNKNQLREQQKKPAVREIWSVFDDDTFTIDLLHLTLAETSQEKNFEVRVRLNFHAASPDDKYPYIHGAELQLYSPAFPLSAEVLPSFSFPQERPDDTNILRKLRDPSNDSQPVFKEIAEQLSKSKVPTEKEAWRSAAAALVKNKVDIDDREGFNVTGLYRLGSDAPPFASAGDLIWEVQISRHAESSINDLTKVIWISSASGKAKIVLPSNQNNER